MKKGKGLGVVLLLVSVILYIPLSIIGFIVSTIFLTVKFRLKEGLSHIDNLFYSMAYSVDQLGNVTCKHLFNLTLIKKSKKSHKFGDPDETISAVLGYNKKRDTLTRTGRLLSDILHFIDPDHVEKAALIEENNRTFIDELYNASIISQDTYKLAKQFLTDKEQNKDYGYTSKK